MCTKTNTPEEPAAPPAPPAEEDTAVVEIVCCGHSPPELLAPGTASPGAPPRGPAIAATALRGNFDEGALCSSSAARFCDMLLVWLASLSVTHRNCDGAGPPLDLLDVSLVIAMHL